MLVQVASMEAQLGRLAGVIRTKDAEATALNAAVQRQFVERTELRGQVAVLDGQVAQLRGATADLEARLRDSEARCAALDAKHNRCPAAASAGPLGRHRTPVSTLGRPCIVGAVRLACCGGVVRSRCLCHGLLACTCCD